MVATANRNKIEGSQGAMLTRGTMEGIYALVPTPYTEKGTFDDEVFRENVKKLCEAGVHGIITTGSVGEFHTISLEDHKRLVKALAEEANQAQKRFVTVVGCSDVNTKGAIEKASFAQKYGIDAVMNVVPFYVRPLTKEEVLNYWEELVRACPNIGVIIYNNPITTGFLHDAEIYKDLKELQTIAGTKETIPDFTHWMSIVEATDLAHFHIDSMVVPTMMWGGKGITSFIACVKPKLILETYEACKKKEWEKAKKLQSIINRILSYYSVIERYGYRVRPGGDPSAYKVFIEAAGFLKCGDPAKPLLPVPREIKKKVTEALRKELDRVDGVLESLKGEGQ